MSSDNPIFSTVAVIKTGLAMMTAGEKKVGWLLSICLFFITIIDMVALSSVMPLVSLVLEPDAFLKNEKIILFMGWIGNPGKEQLLTIFMALSLSLLITSAFLRIGIEYFIVKFTSNCRVRIAGDIMGKFVETPYHWFLMQNSTVLSRILYADVVQWARGFLQSMMVMFGNVITLIFGVVTVVLLAPVVGVTVVSIVGGCSALLLFFTKASIKKISIEQRKITDVLTKTSQQVVVGIKDVRLSSNSGYFKDSFNDAYRQFADIDKKNKILSVSPPIIVLLLGQVSILIVVAVLWKQNVPTSEIAAQVTLLLLVSSKVIPAVNRLTSSISNFWKIYPFVNGVKQISDEMDQYIEQAKADNLATCDIQSSANGFAINVENVSYRYAVDEKHVLNSVNLNIEANKSHAVIGASGAGKTTLIDIILGLLSPSEGQVLINGEPLGIKNVMSWQKQIGHVPQSPIIFDDTILNNIAFGVRPEEIDHQHVSKCVKLANLSDMIDSFEVGLDTYIGERGVRISGGQRQRIAIARALYLRPKILIMDEATSALDMENERVIQEAIDSLHGKLTTVIIAHRLATVRDCDKIFLLETGELKAEGTWDELMKISPLFQKLSKNSVV